MNMKPILVVLSAISLQPAAFAASTININTNQQSSYGANIGWMNWRGDSGTNGVVVSEFWLSGYIWAANLGWIKVAATNVPPNNFAWQNTAATNFGVNIVNDNELRGYAYGANIGWIVFTNRSDAGLLLDSETPHINFNTGNFTGYAYGANVGWINLSNAFARVQTDTIQAGPDTDGDGIADAWELQHAGNLTTLSGAGHDQDGDGVSDVDEYRADTEALDPASRLRITAITANSLGSTSTVTWTSRPTRLYQVQSRTNLVTGAWGTNSPPGLVSPDVGSLTSRTAPGTPITNRFFRVQAIQPLMP